MLHQSVEQPENKKNLFFWFSGIATLPFMFEEQVSLLTR